MADLVLEHFQRDLSADEEEALASQLAASPDDAVRFSELAEAEYRRFRQPPPGLPRLDKQWLWTSLGALALAGLWLAWPQGNAKGPQVVVDETPYTLQAGKEGGPARTAGRREGASEQSNSSSHLREDDLLLTRIPDSPRLAVAVRLAEDGPVSVEVYGPQGKLVQRVHQGELGAGAHVFTTASLGSGGRYQVRMKTERGELKRWAQVEWR